MEQNPRPQRRVARFLIALTLILGLLGSAGVAVTRAQDDAGVPAVGVAVPFVGTEGSVLAEITIAAVADPFQDYDPNSFPQRSFHFVLLTLTVENTGSRPFSFDPNAIAVQDSEGFLARPIYLPRTEASLAALADFPAGEIPAGDTVTGALAYQVLNGVGVGHVVYLPASDRLVVLASVAGGGGSTGATTTTRSETEDASPVATDAEASEAAASGLDCAVAAEWATGTGERLDTVFLLVEELETFDLETADPVRLGEIADEFQDLADTQAAAETPEELSEANDQFVTAYEDFAAAFEVVTDAAADGDIEAVADDVNAAILDANAILVQAGELAQTELAACGLS